VQVGCCVSEKAIQNECETEEIKIKIAVEIEYIE
jgi:hypothetical protein